MSRRDKIWFGMIASMNRCIRLVMYAVNGVVKNSTERIISTHYYSTHVPVFVLDYYRASFVIIINMSRGCRL